MSRKERQLPLKNYEPEGVRNNGSDPHLQKDRKVALKEKDPYQLAEWKPRQNLTSGYSESIDDIANVILLNRGFTLEDIPSLESPRIPTAEEAGLDVLSLDKAAERFKKAALLDEKVLVYGDSDADGVCSTFEAYKMLTESFGIRTVHTITPARDDHGYGFNDFVSEKFSGEYPLIVTVDCGIGNKSQIEKAKEKGTDVVVMDHHKIQKEQYPTNATIIHTTETSAAGIVYLTAKYYHEKFDLPMPDILPIAAIAVHADNMTMDSRVSHPIVKMGIEQIRKNPPDFLKALAGEKQRDLLHFTDQDISFTYGPTLNAPGRYGKGTLALHLLRSNDVFERNRLANELRKMNVDRKKDSKLLLEKILTDYNENQRDNNYVFYADTSDEFDFPPMFLSPVVSRVLYSPGINRPVILGKTHVSKETGEEICTYEARSPAGLVDLSEMVEGLKKQELLVSGGGHFAAVGFTSKSEDIQRVNEWIGAYMKENIKGLVNSPTGYDIEVPLRYDLLAQIVEFQNKIRPFSYGLEAALLLSENVEVLRVEVSESKVVVGEKHLYLTLRDSDYSDRQIKAKTFNAAHKLLGVQAGEKIDLLYKVGENTFNGRTTIEIMPEDFRQSKRRPRHRAPILPSREDFKAIEEHGRGYINVPEEIEEQFENPSVVGFDLDDTIRVPNPWAVALRFACMEAYVHTGDERYREGYSIPRKDSAEWYGLLEDIRRVSESVYGDGTKVPELVSDAQDRILQNGEAYTKAWRTEEERPNVYINALGFKNKDEFLKYYLGKFTRGLRRRPDEFDFITPGAVSTLNYLTLERGIEVSLISNSASRELLDTEELLRQEGFGSRFKYKISANSMNKTKPDPYALRNLIMQEKGDGEFNMLYVGNSEADVKFAKNATDFENCASDHPLNPEEIRVTPVIITRGADYSDLDLPLHAEFGTLFDFEEYMRQQSSSTSVEVFNSADLRRISEPTTFQSPSENAAD